MAALSQLISSEFRRREADKYVLRFDTACQSLLMRLFRVFTACAQILLSLCLSLLMREIRSIVAMASLSTIMYFISPILHFILHLLSP